MLENIQKLCKERGIKVSHLEKELGFGRGAMYKWDVNSPSIDKVQKVADYFKVSMDRILYGFDYTEFVNMVNYVKENRTIEQFSKETGVDLNELYKICLGLTFNPPSLEVVEKIASSNPVDFIVSRDDLLEAAGYVNERRGGGNTRKMIDVLSDQFEKAGFSVRFENEDHYEKVYIDHEDQTVQSMFLHEFIDIGESILEALKEKYKKYEPKTIAAHHDGEDWTEEELEDIKQFKEFVRSKRKQQE
ncbi:Cro/C1-type HTH DNA-binding domain-containing protein [Paenibacillus tianmuensis]|uniref:Cro/C1-type HTH DNA-binding domain-containing protein n=1 Tax=Paenibacillus tianmuensis TaxID=624147 RepID=A0A1G4Q9H7_9BACL|nr:Cro/C1-type HTH DNA-binding domain-containing protein [Paenibacillus tianmuensis]